MIRQRVDRRLIDPPFQRTKAGVAYRVFGRGEPLFLLHGGAGNWHHWVLNVDALSERFQVVAIDQPSYGDSDAVPWETPTQDYLGYCFAAISEISGEAERVHVAGFSFGGYIAAEMAVRLGDRAAALSMTGGAGYGPPDGRPFTLGSRKRLEDALGRSPTDDELTAMHRENLGKLMLWDQDRVDPWAVDMQRRNVERTRFDSRRLSWADGTPDRVGRLSCPVMIVYGEHDAACIPTIATRLDRCRAVNPNVVTHVIEDCGHWAMYEAPSIVNRLMLDFHGSA
ncbi:MAG: alpha/beta hydrolase [Pseudomonadota bacterium]